MILSHARPTTLGCLLVLEAEAKLAPCFVIWKYALNAESQVCYEVFNLRRMGIPCCLGLNDFLQFLPPRAPYARIMLGKI